MHVHEVTFEVVDRQALVTNDDGETIPPARLVGDPRPPEPWEIGRKDTVIAYPGEVTRIRAKFDTPGTFVWHCHIVSHEDNEMMRPYRIGPADPKAPDSGIVNQKRFNKTRDWLSPVSCILCFYFYTLCTIFFQCVPAHQHLFLFIP